MRVEQIENSSNEYLDVWDVLFCCQWLIHATIVLNTLEEVLHCFDFTHADVIRAAKEPVTNNTAVVYERVPFQLRFSHIGCNNALIVANTFHKYNSTTQPKAVSAPNASARSNVSLTCS